MSKKILVCYLFTKFDSHKSLTNFIKFYKKYPSGISHKLLICFKLIDKKKILIIKKLLKNFKFIEYIDPFLLNDYDFGSYSRVSSSYPSHRILFLNSHSYPVTKMWLKKINTHYKNKTIIGFSSSNESMFTSLKLKKFYKFFSFLRKYLKYKKNFKSFPNPHLRTSSFYIKGSDLLKFLDKKKLHNKESAWIAESGFNGLTNFFRKLNYKIYIVNSDGIKFTEDKWMFSETFNYLKQSKNLISDKHTRKYLSLSNKQKSIFQKNTWGEE